MKEDWTEIAMLIGLVIVGVILPLSFLLIYPPASLSKKSNEPKVDTFLYQGHTMLKVQCGKTISVCHSPECLKCIMVYD
jgi:hypothetical protein